MPGWSKAARIRSDRIEDHEASFIPAHRDGAGSCIVHVVERAGRCLDNDNFHLDHLNDHDDGAHSSDIVDRDDIGSGGAVLP